MKKIFFLLLVVAITNSSFSQSVAINSNGASADNSAMLDVSANNKGVLIPRLTTAQRTAIANPANGLLVFDVTTNSFWFFSTIWKEINNGGGGAGFTLPYIASYSDPDKVFSITNPSVTPGGLAIHGKRTSVGSGVNPAFSMGVWGDNSDGAGVVGTSNTGIGSYGFSFQNHGIYGFSTGNNFAGVYGTSSAALGAGVMGEITQAGNAVYGKSTGQFGSGALFLNSNALNEDAVLKSTHLGKGNAAIFANTNLATFPAVRINNNGISNGLLINSLLAANTTAAMEVYNHGKGAGINVTLPEVTNTSDAISSTNLGTGAGIYATSPKGISGMFYTPVVTTENETINATTYGKGSAGVFFKSNTTGSISDTHKPAVLIENVSKGNALKITSLHSPSVSSGIDVLYDGQAAGINVSSTKIGIHAVSTSASTSIMAENFFGGMAIRGAASGTDTAAIYGITSGSFGSGVLGVTTSQLGVGVRGRSSSDLMGAVVGENSSAGGGVVGVATGGVGAFGYGVIGETGNGGGWGVAGMFRTNNPTANVNTIWALDYSLGTTFLITINNDNNNSPAMEINHNGTGKLASFRNASGERISFSNGGNITTAGTVTVKNNKGIVRSSTASQLRYETAATATITSVSLGVGSSLSVTVNFSTAFGSAPVVAVGNIHNGFTGPCDKLSTSITSVTTTSCTFTITNNGSSATGVISGVWNIIAIGAE